MLRLPVILPQGHSVVDSILTLNVTFEVCKPISFFSLMFLDLQLSLLFLVSVFCAVCPPAVTRGSIQQGAVFCGTSSRLRHRQDSWDSVSLFRPRSGSEWVPLWSTEYLSTCVDPFICVAVHCAVPSIDGLR